MTDHIDPSKIRPSRAVADELESAAVCSLDPDPTNDKRYERRLRCAIAEAVSAIRRVDVVPHVPAGDASITKAQRDAIIDECAAAIADLAEKSINPHNRSKDKFTEGIEAAGETVLALKLEESHG